MPLHAASGRKLAEETGEVISGKTIEIRLSQNLGLFLRKKIQKWSGDLTFALSRNKHKFAQISSTCSYLQQRTTGIWSQFRNCNAPDPQADRAFIRVGPGFAPAALRYLARPCSSKFDLSIIMIY